MWVKMSPSLFYHYIKTQKNSDKLPSFGGGLIEVLFAKVTNLNKTTSDIILNQLSKLTFDGCVKIVIFEK